MFVDNDYNNGLNGSNNLNSNARFLGITLKPRLILMKSYKNLWLEICSFDNLESAFYKARKGKSKKPYVLEFERNLTQNILELKDELLLQTYHPKPLETFILRDPKTRKISKSDFRDRIVHHAIVNILEPIFDKSFVYDSYANRKGKGTLKALQRFDYFKRKASENNSQNCFVLKADIKHYFDEVDCGILLKIISRKIKNANVLELIEKINANFRTQRERESNFERNALRQFNFSIFR